MWMFAPRSVRYSSLPAFASRTALPMSKVTVPVFGFGIRPRGPRMRPRRPTFPIWSGVAMATSKSVNPSSTCFARSAEPTTSAPASSASRVRVDELRLGDLPHLGAGQPPDLVAVRLGGALLEPQRLLDEDCGRRRLRDERERAILEDGDLHRGDAAVLVRRLRVERLAE